jgi:3-oxo-5-alpha-steroid 4-dehydrogenase 1
MDVYNAYRVFVAVWIGCAVLVGISLLSITVPYGRHLKDTGGQVSAKKGWMLMELPAALSFFLCFVYGAAEKNVTLLIFFLLWELHYINRSVVYPLRIQGDRRQMTLSVVGMAFFFNLINGSVNGIYIFSIAEKYDILWLVSPQFIIGTLLFITGMGINLKSDRVLRNLRKTHDRSNGQPLYEIPEHFLFRFVSCPNYFGELVEWLGWAVLTFSLPGASFFIWTAANLLPRARAHHRWYRDTFPAYPEERRAIIPYIL